MESILEHIRAPLGLRFHSAAGGRASLMSMFTPYRSGLWSTRVGLLPSACGPGRRAPTGAHLLTPPALHPTPPPRPLDTTIAQLNPGLTEPLPRPKVRGGLADPPGGWGGRWSAASDPPPPPRVPSAMGEWAFLGSLLDAVQLQSPLVGRLWLVVMLIFRILVLATVGGAVFEDEQEEFVCNTLQPGCRQTCYDRAFPVSHYRFWLFHILLLSAPPVLFVIYAVHRAGKGAGRGRGRGGGGGGGRGPRAVPAPPLLPAERGAAPAGRAGLPGGPGAALRLPRGPALRVRRRALPAHRGLLREPAHREDRLRALLLRRRAALGAAQRGRAGPPALEGPPARRPPPPRARGGAAAPAAAAAAAAAPRPLRPARLCAPRARPRQGVPGHRPPGPGHLGAGRRGSRRAVPATLAARALPGARGGGGGGGGGGVGAGG
uniref:Connexin N-terminal domain-containing protein n=1 Tax=Canis lupus familiaris TaxID=9615 RepID=A0A8C0RKV7_CANLF